MKRLRHEEETQVCIGECRKEQPIENFWLNQRKYVSKKTGKLIVYRSRKQICTKCSNKRRSERSKLRRKGLI